MAFQNFALFPHMSASENIATPLRAAKADDSKVASGVARVAKLLKIDHVLGHAPRELSNGQKQRTALARALAAEPKILLLDDPLRNVDAKLRFEMRLELPRLLRQSGATVLYVTQDYKEAMALADRIAVLAGGKFVQVATPEDIYLTPATLNVARLFGDPSINTAETEIAAKGKQVSVTIHGTSVPVGAAYAGATGRKVVFGVRPEAVVAVCLGRWPALRGGGHHALERARGVAAQVCGRLGVSGLAAVFGQGARSRCKTCPPASPPKAHIFLTLQQVSASMAELVISKVDKIYRPRRKQPVHAVQDLNLTVKDGEIVAFLGSSGCGKTSTLRMIAGFEDVSNGSITLGGKAIHTLPPSQRGVAMAFEAYSLYPPLTIGDNIAFALKSSSLSSDEQQRRVKAMAEMLDIAGILQRYPSSVSGGQQQRASLGRALVRDAGLYLLDEPMGQLEPQLRAILRGRIKAYLRQHNCTTILVTHDQTEANALADRIAVMEGGVLQQYASPAELKARPANLYTGTFVGEPPMNVFAVEVDATAKNVTFRIDPKTALTYPASEFSKVVLDTLSSRNALSIGIRPYALRVGKGPISGQVVACQWLGDQTHVAVDVAGRTVVSVAHDRINEKPGNTLSLNVAAEDLHLFDTDSGKAIAHGGELA